ncbi:MAG: thioredoxin family protein [Sulfurospirillum sp.]|nr:thioredoxin family protein [Sulfurospirillum sp.]MBP9612202.1 thioredoxin family protein [Sulfurospirillum sp.]
MKIEVLGKGCAKCETLLHVTKEAVKKGSLWIFS